ARDPTAPEKPSGTGTSFQCCGIDGKGTEQGFQGCAANTVRVESVRSGRIQIGEQALDASGFVVVVLGLFVGACEEEHCGAVGPGGEFLRHAASTRGVHVVNLL